MEDRRVYVNVMCTRLERLDAALRGQSTHQIREGRPTVLDLIDVPDVVQLVQLPTTIDVSQRFCSVMIDGYIQQWRERRAASLSALLGPPIVTMAASASTTFHPTAAVATPLVAVPSPASGARVIHSSPASLNHPLALFWCDGCKETVSGVEAMTHRCCYGFRPNWDKFQLYCSPWFDGAYSRIVEEGVDLFERTCIVHARGKLPWSSSKLRPCADIVHAILVASGLKPEDPHCAISDDVHFVCLSCSETGLKVSVKGAGAAGTGGTGQ